MEVTSSGELFRGWKEGKEGTCSIGLFRGWREGMEDSFSVELFIAGGKVWRSLAQWSSSETEWKEWRLHVQLS